MTTVETGDVARSRPSAAGGAGSLDSAERTREELLRFGYLADRKAAGVVHLASALGKPVLAEGPAGTGKTQLAKSVAEMTGRRLVRLQCYEGLDESRALYEWDYRKQLLAIQATSSEASGDRIRDVFSEEYLLSRPLLEAIRSEERVVLLIDEVDQLDMETEALLLEVLSDFQVSIPELGTVTARQQPLVFLTSNHNRELTEAIKRRCLYLAMGYPEPEQEREIILARVPGVSDALAERISRVVAAIRAMELKKAPSVAETLDWARTLALYGREEVTSGDVLEHLYVLLKHTSDIEAAAAEFGDGAR